MHALKHTVIDGRGEFFRLGSIFRRSEDGGTRIRDDEGITSEVDANYGYTIVSGRFMTKIRQGEFILHATVS